MMKKLTIMLSILFFSTAFANSPKEINLVFQDRTLTLNFEAQPELLREAPKNFLIIKNQKIPIDLNENLPFISDFWEIHTEFLTEISPEKLHEFFLASSILRENDNKKTVEILLDKKNNILFEGKPRDGFEIKEEVLVDLLNRAIHLGKKYVRVPAEKIFSEVAIHPDLQTRGIKEIIAVGESNFTGSSLARKQNILAGAKKFNSVIVPQGKIFSFNQNLGDVSEENGFVRELVIKGSQTEKELGGGVCQVSTTAFRAAFSGGLPISQRRNHSYAVSYYKPYGLDAAIYLGAQDMRFRNDTPGDILIQTFNEGDNLFFVFYGTNDGREVTLEGPFISNYKEAPEAIVYKTEDLPIGAIQEIGQAHDGFQAEWIRKVSKKGEVDTQNFVSNYRPWAARQLIGTKVSLKRN